MKSITIEQLKTVSKDLATRISQLASQLKEEKHGVKSSYWVDVDIAESKMFLIADNGFDISESIEVTNGDKEKILALL